MFEVGPVCQVLQVAPEQLLRGAETAGVGEGGVTRP
jgi:hypothetical protein